MQRAQVSSARVSLRRAGFTLIEMMVVLVIVSILTTAIVANYGSFRSATVATNMAYEAATTVRQAQLYGLGVRGVLVDSAYEFGGTYGVEFAADMASYSIFRDGAGTNPLNGRCDDGCDCSNQLGECVEQVRMLQAVTVEAICASPSAAIETADLMAGAYCTHDAGTVTFTRPNPEGTIRVGSPGNLNEGFALLGIVIRGGEHCRLVRVYSNGQISVEGLVGDTDGDGDCDGA
jgi:prepilin-type N-terminal cleavage/methylation domain-containing protein